MINQKIQMELEMLLGLISYIIYLESHQKKRPAANANDCRLHLHSTPASAARRGLFFRLLPLCRKPLDLVESSVLDRVPTPFSSFTDSGFSFACEYRFLFFPFSAAAGLFVSLLVIPVFPLSTSSSSIFSTSSSSMPSFSGFCGRPLLFCAGIFSSSPLPVSS
ncbi:hypothetical protein OIU84_023445 [Salix udensis]|uniref:Uncharacterized protein n=1 Tax=Salix udensis TaxID=889485 RepID=A0AAD6KQT8_9ROSI|nr:hypothetical protein OIU84_023445 [Salix udensis]